MSLKALFKITSKYPIPIMAGILAALVWANLSPKTYNDFINYSFFEFLWHPVTIKLIINDIFMAFFMGLAMVEVVIYSKKRSAKRKKETINILFSTIGGVCVPVILFFVLTGLLHSGDTSIQENLPTKHLCGLGNSNGYGYCTGFVICYVDL